MKGDGGGVLSRPVEGCDLWVSNDDGHAGEPLRPKCVHRAELPREMVKYPVVINQHDRMAVHHRPDRHQQDVSQLQGLVEHLLEALRSIHRIEVQKGVFPEAFRPGEIGEAQPIECSGVVSENAVAIVSTGDILPPGEVLIA